MELRTREAPSLILDSIETPDSLIGFERLLNQAFPVPAGSSYFDDFPVWREAPEPVCRMGVRQADGTLVTCAAARIAPLRIAPQGRAAQVALIGAVATDPGWRGKGLASRCVQVAADWALAQGAEAALLWSSELAFYERLGFQPAGRQLLLPLEALELGSRTAAPRRGWVQGIFRLLQSRTEGLLLADSDRRWVEAHRNIEWLWSGDPERPAAFVAIGKGIDLPGIIHEWGGDPEAVKGILATLARTRAGLRVLGSPEGLAALAPAPAREVADGTAAATADEALCLARVLRPEGESWIRDGRFWLWGLDGA